MKIKITTARSPWVDGKPQAEGAEIEVSEADAKALIGAGFAEVIDAPKAAKKGAKE